MQRGFRTCDGACGTTEPVVRRGGRSVGCRLRARRGHHDPGGARPRGDFILQLDDSFGMKRESAPPPGCEAQTSRPGYCDPGRVRGRLRHRATGSTRAERGARACRERFGRAEEIPSPRPGFVIPLDYDAGAMSFMRALAAAWSEPELVQAPLAQLTWYRHVTLIEKLDTNERRAWYATHAGGAA